MKTQKAMMTVAELEHFLDQNFPQVHMGGRSFFVDRVWHGGCAMHCAYHERHLRPGGTMSGPAMMTLADLAFYVAILASLGPVALAVTTNLSINFLRKPAARALIAECRLLKIGKRLVVGEVLICSEGEDELVAHVTGTYSVPPTASGR